MRKESLTLLRLPFAVFLAPLALGCGGGNDTAPSKQGTPDGARIVFDLTADLASPDHFYDVPYPNDLRLDADGHPMLAGFPNPKNLPLVAGFIGAAQEARGFPVIPVAYLRFTAELAPRVLDDVILADATSPILLVDVDAGSPEKGRLIPVVAQTTQTDPYVPEWLLSVAARPGFVLLPNTRYAVVVRASAHDAAGNDLVRDPAFARIAQHKPKGELEAKADALYAPLWDTLDGLGIAKGEVVGATVFTTGDVVADLAELSQKLVEKYDIALTNLKPFDDPEVTELCILSGSVEMPEFQVGTPPYNTEGLFTFGSDGLPVEQHKQTVPIKIVLPKVAMPAAGYPLMLNIHGSGGYSIAMVRPVGDDGQPGVPIGPAFPYAARGIAMAGMAMPANPERLPGASETAYLNPNNLAAMRDTFRQGQIELRLFIEALTKLNIDPAALGSCAGPTLPAGQSAFHFDAKNFLVTGQSMGGMYTNIIAATEPLLRAAVPTGAGGYWPHFIMHTPLNGGAFPGLIKLILQTGVPISHVHPVFGIAAGALEPADPIVHMPRVARRPLPGHPVRPIYEPVAPQDSYFAQETYDAVVLAYGHEEAGEVQWPSMQEALALEQLDGVIPFPVEDNLKSADGSAYTGVVVQWAPKALPGETKADGHAIYSHRDDVKYQYGCFADSFLKTGHAKVLVPQQDWKASCD